MALDLKAKILANRPQIVEVIDVEEWGVKIGLRSPTVAERARAFSEMSDENGQVPQELMQALVTVLVVADPETGDAVFTLEDLTALMDTSAGPVGRIFLKGLSLAGLQREAVEAGKDGS